MQLQDTPSDDENNLETSVPNKIFDGEQPPIILKLPDNSQIDDLKWMHVWSQTLDLDIANFTFPDEAEINSKENVKKTGSSDEKSGSNDVSRTIDTTNNHNASSNANTNQKESNSSDGKSDLNDIASYLSLIGL